MSEPPGKSPVQAQPGPTPGGLLLGPCAARSRPCALPFSQLVARRPGCNPRGLQKGEGPGVLAGREEVVKSIKEKPYRGGGRRAVMIVCKSLGIQILLSLFAACVF